MTYRRLLAELIDAKRDIDSIGSDAQLMNDEHLFSLYHEVECGLSAMIESLSRKQEKEPVNE